MLEQNVRLKCSAKCSASVSASVLRVVSPHRAALFQHTHSFGKDLVWTESQAPQLHFSLSVSPLVFLCAFLSMCICMPVRMFVRSSWAS